jgi:predicted esterase YcpF (UPF0227 family)
VIVYLHGFRSSPASRKATMLREAMARRGRSADYVCPALPASPAQAIEVVQRAVAGVSPAHLALIGSSLGGYYATWMAERLGCCAVLLNPAIRPQDDLARHLGVQPVYFSDVQIEFRREYLAELEAIDTPAITRPERYFLIAATGDAVIDYRSMVRKYEGARQHVIAGSDHELADFSQYLDEVLAFCDAGTTTRISEGREVR